jgi:hypothetical protein
MPSVIVFTAILGGSDSLKPAPADADRCVCFTDGKHRDAKGWELVQTTAAGDPRRTAWHLRCVPHDLFKGYSRVVWIDASFTLTNLPRLLHDTGKESISALRHHERNSCYREGRRLVRNRQATGEEIEAQLAAYEAEKFQPEHLSISCVIVRDRSEAVHRFNETWDQQIQTWPGDNTQVSLDYSAWKSGLTIHCLKGTRHQNPYARHDHLDHLKRRRPYRPAQFQTEITPRTTTQGKVDRLTI